MNLHYLNKEYSFGSAWYCDKIIQGISNKKTNAYDFLSNDKTTCVIQPINNNQYEVIVNAISAYRKIHKFIITDPESYNEIEQIFSIISDLFPIRFVLIHTLEYLNDPRPLLRFLRISIQQNEYSELIINSIVYDEKLINQYIDYRRVWKTVDLNAFLTISGFIIDKCIFEYKESYLYLSSNTSAYEIFLKTVYLPANNSYMIVSQEHGTAQITGGIGTYVEEVEKLLEGKVTVLLIPPVETMYPSISSSMQKRHLLASSFYHTEDITYERLDEITKECIEIAIYLYDKLKVIELQDVNGKGYMALQAYNLGKYPSSIFFKTFCHASRVVLEKLYKRYSECNDRELYEEKYVIEQSDEIIFPTEFLRKFYIQQGYLIPKEHSIICRLPFDFPSQKKTCEEYLMIDTLIFFGKRIHYKGFTYFTAMIEALFQQNILSKTIKTIILIGPKFDEMEKENGFFDFLGTQGFCIKEFNLKRTEALGLINECRNRSICITPYVSDNHPNSVLEVIGEECLLLATNRGGIPELIPQEFHSLILFDLNVTDMITKVLYWIDISPEHRLKCIKKLKQLVVENQIDINLNNQKRFTEIHVPNMDINHIDRKLLILTYCESQIDMDKIQNIIQSQSVQPEKVIIFSKIKFLLNYDFNIPTIFQHALDTNVTSYLGDYPDYFYCAFISPRCDYASSYISLLKSSIKHADCDYVTSNMFDRNQKKKFLGDGLVNATVNNTVGTPFGIYKTASIRQCSSVTVTDIFINRSFLVKFISEGFSIKIYPEFLFSSDLELIPETYDDITTYIEQVNFLNHFDTIRAIGYLHRLKENQEQNIAISLQVREAKKSLHELTSSKSWKLLNKIKKTKIYDLYILFKKTKEKLLRLN